MAGVKGRSGGARLGSGPKRRDPKAAWLTGAKPAKPTLAAVKSVREAVEGPACPKDADPETAAVWKELAPHAIAQGTLEHRTVLGFVLLCRNVVLERKLATAPLTCAGPDHRGMLMRVEAGLARFRLIADGKPAIGDETPKDEWAEFDAPLTVLHGGKS